ncbi:MAG TPA: hypothetical protein PLO68_16275, partial [Sedimentisphaerales bacterium]|nr:hypothetical protein [Sedimentisphaerales bacterium]
MLMEKVASWSGLRLDGEREAERITQRLRESLRDKLKRRGVVVAFSGGIDSSVVGGLCVRALGPERVFGL